MGTGLQATITMHSAVRAVKVRIPTVPYFTDVGYGLTHCLLLCLCCRIWFNSLPALFVGLDVVYLTPIIVFVLLE